MTVLNRLSLPAVIAAFFIFVAPAQAADSAQAFIESMAGRAVAALTTPDVPRDERIKRFRVLFNDHFAVKGIAKWVLGRYWGKATDAEQAEYVTLFEDYIVASYVDRFAEYAGQSLIVVKVADDGDGIHIVFSEIRLPDTGSTPVRVNWRVERTGDNFLVTDVQVEGVSMGSTLRSDFGSIVRGNGGKISALLDVMRGKTKELQKGG